MITAWAECRVRRMALTQLRSPGSHIARTGSAFRTGSALVALLLATLLPVPATHAADARSQIDLVADPAWARIGEIRDGKAPTGATDGVRYLLAEDQVNLTGDKPVWHRRVVYEVVQQRGLAAAGQFSIEFDPQYQRVRLHAVDLWRDGARQDRRDRSRVEMLRRESDLEMGLLDGRHTLSVTIPDLRVGDRIDYRFSIAGFNPVFGGDYHDVYSASYSTPVAERRVYFVYPSSLPLQWRVSRPGYEVKQQQRDGERFLEFSARNLGKVREETSTPETYDAYGTLQFSTMPDWKAVARWASPLYPRRFSDRALATSLAEKLALDPADKTGSLVRAIAFAQGEIRYTGLDMGQNSHAPNPPELTIDRRFGDCKDKSLLLVALLAEAGIEAEPVLVDTVSRGGIRAKLPSPLAFNHVVVRAMHQGRPVWIDPTRSRERGALGDREPLAFDAGLPVHDPAGLLVRIPQEMPGKPLVDVEERIGLTLAGDDVSAAFHVETAYGQGHAAGVRDNFANNGAEEVGKQYLRYMRGFYEGLRSTAEPSINDAEDRDLVRTAEKYRLEWNRKKDGSLFGVVLFQLSDWLPSLEDEARRAPLQLSGPRAARHSIRTSLDEGWSIQPETAKVANRYFSFERTVRVDGKDLVVQGKWERFAEEVPARDYSLLRKDFDEARELLSFDVELDAGTSGFPVDFSPWRWPLLSLLILALLLATAWSMRTRNAFAGMLFRPRSTMTIIGAGTLWKAMALLGLVGVLGALVGPGSEYMHDRDPLKLGAAIGSVAGYGIRMLIWVALLRWAFKLLSTTVAFRNLLIAGAWGSAPPLILLIGCALIAIAGNVEVFADKYVPVRSETPGIVVAAVLAIVGAGWSVLSSLNAYSVVAGTTRSHAAAAMGIVAAASLALLVPIGLLMYFK